MIDSMYEFLLIIFQLKISISVINFYRLKDQLQWKKMEYKPEIES